MRCLYMKRLFPVTLFLVLLVAACAPPPNLRDDTLLNDRSLVTSDPCAAPCFRGITPGETSWRDAIVLIEDDPDFTNIQEQTDEESGARQASWQQGENRACCQMASQDGETVSLLFLQIAPNMTVGEVIETHGEPSYLVGSEYTDDQAIITVVYPDTPMVVYLFVDGAATGELSATSEVIGALYLTDTEMELLLQTTDLHAWEGYQSFVAYNDGPFEVTPSITLTPTPEG
jgi:hypothetical protein